MKIKKCFKSFSSVFVMVLICCSMMVSNASAASTAANPVTKDYVFLVANTIGYAPFGATVHYTIGANYTRIPRNSTTSIKTSLYTGCGFWGGSGVADLSVYAGYSVSFYNDNGSSLGLQQLTHNGGPIITGDSIFSYNESTTPKSLNCARITAKGGGGVTVPDALYPTQSYTNSVTF